MSDNENESGLVAGWWAASTDADHEQVTLYRKEGSTESLLDRFTVTRDTMPTLEDFQLEVKKNFGGGEFVAVMRGNQGQFARRIKFAVAGLPKREAEPAPGTGQATGLAEIAALLTRQQEASEARMMALMEKLAAQPAGDPMDKALDLMVKVQKLQAPARSSLEGLKEFAELRALMRELAGDDAAPKSDGFADLLKAAMPMLAEVTKQGTELEKIKAAVALRKAGMPPRKPAPAPAPTREPMPPEVAEQLAQLLTVAGVMPAEDLAEVVAQQLGDEEAQAVVDAIDGTDWLAQLIEQEPRAKQHAEWLETFAAKLLELLTDEPIEPDSTAETPGGDIATGHAGHAADAEGNGGADPAGGQEPGNPRASGAAGYGATAKGLLGGGQARTSVGA